MLYIVGDYVHTRTQARTQLNTLSLHTHTDTHTPNQLNVSWSNTFCVNISFLLPKQIASLLLQHAQWGLSHCPAAGNRWTHFWVSKILQSYTKVVSVLFVAGRRRCMQLERPVLAGFD